MKIVVMTDVHANLPALRAALEAIKRDGYDIIVHTGDAIAIGPYPDECLDVLLNTRDTRLIMGNHESYCVEGLTNPRSSGMSDGEVLHQIWTHEQIRRAFKPVVAQWPYRLDLENCGVNAAFMHYPLDASGRDFARIRLVEPTVADLEAAFSSIRPQLVFCGHEHSPFDVRGARATSIPVPWGAPRIHWRDTLLSRSRRGDFRWSTMP